MEKKISATQTKQQHKTEDLFQSCLSSKHPRQRQSLVYFYTICPVFVLRANDLLVTSVPFPNCRKFHLVADDFDQLSGL